MHRNVLACAAVVGGCLVSAASAQFVTAVTQPTFSQNVPAVYVTDVGDGSSAFLFNPIPPAYPATAPGFTGLAANDAARQFYATVRNGPQDDLYVVDYDTLTPTKLSTLRRPGTTTGMSVEGLAYDTTKNKIYVSRSLGGSTGPEGLLEIDPATGDSTLILEFETTSTSLYSIGAIDFDPLTQLLYLVDEDDTGGRNIYSVDPSAGTPALTFVAELPLPITDVDGLGAGNGMLYLLSDGPDILGTSAVEGNGGNHYVYDIAAGTFSILGPTPYPEYTNSGALGRINPSGAGMFAPGLVPEPATLGLLAAFAVVGLRRR